MVDPPKTTRKAKNGGFSLKIIKNDLQNGENPPFRGLGVVLGGSTIKSKMSGDQFYIILDLDIAPLLLKNV